jgi:RNA polymerase sigma-70 factor (ECF subfamily)
VTTGLEERSLKEAFGRHRRELHLHCYRMLASFDEAEDAVQEAHLRAWKKRASFDGDNVRAWMYRIATNVSLDMLRVRSRQASRLESLADLPWLQPYPDRLLDEMDDSPDAVAIERETIELTFVAALQVLAPRQRAAFLARDVLGWSAAETAGLLGSSVAATNSAVQRARAKLRERLPPQRSEWSSRRNREERAVLTRFIDAHERLDTAAALELVTADIRVSMPPDGLSFRGIESISPLLERAMGNGRDGDWRLVATAANRLPAAASYLLRPADTRHRAFKLDVIEVTDGRIRAITTFGASRFPAFGLAADL